MTDATFILSYDALSSELDAVNALIGSMGETPVASLEPGNSVDVDNALAALNEADKQLQGKGYEWNREYQFPLAIAQDGTIPVPANVLRVVKAYFQPQFSIQSPLKFVQRGTKLYNQTLQTYQFTDGPILCDLIVRLEWDLLPEAARSVIILTALGKFQSRQQQSSIVLQYNAEDLKEARATLEQQQDDESAENAIDGNANVIQGLYGIRGLRRNRQGL